MRLSDRLRSSQSEPREILLGLSRRVFPGTDPEKTDGVKMSLNLTANIIREMNPNLKITRTNIDGFLLASPESSHNMKVLPLE